MKLFKYLICFAVACLVATWPAQGQNAKSVLDKTAAKLKQSGGLTANFVATSFKNNKATGSAAGNICVQGNKFKLTSQSSTTWFNGTTQWALVTGSDEAYVSTPTAAELQSVNPYTFVDLYRQGYDLSMKDATYGGRSCHEVRMLDKQNNKNIREMLVTIDKTNFLPQCVRFRQPNGTWIRIQVSGIETGKKWNDAFFEFSKTDHPGVDVIDLR